MPKTTTVSEALKLDDGTIIPALAGIVETVYEPKEVGRDRPSHLQVIEIGDAKNRRDRITVKLWNQEIDMVPKHKGRHIILQSIDGRDGPYGVAVKAETYHSEKEGRDKTTTCIHVNRADISFVEESARPDDAPPPETPATPPEGEMSREDKLKALHAAFEAAKRDMMKPLNNILLGFEGAIYIRDHVKATHGIELTTDHLVAMLGQIGITGDKYGCFDKVPKCNLTKVFSELHLLSGQEEPKK